MRPHNLCIGLNRDGISGDLCMVLEQIKLAGLHIPDPVGAQLLDEDSITPGELSAGFMGTSHLIC